MYGGIAPNALQAIVDLISSIKDRSGRIQIPGFYDRVQRPSQHEVESWARLPFREEDYLAKEVGATQAIGEPGYSVFERLWARPTFELHGIRGGFTGEGAKTSIPARASAKVSVRLVPDQTTDEAVRQITEAVHSFCPPGVTAKFGLLHAAPAWTIDPENPFIAAAAAAIRVAFRKDPAYVRSGSSMQMVSSFASCLTAPSVVLGFGLPDDQVHAPNEKLYIPNFVRGTQALCGLLEKLGALGD